MARRVTDGARRERHAKSSSRVSRLRRSRARALLSLNLKKKERDCSQSTGNGVDNDSERKVVCIFRLNSKN